MNALAQAGSRLLGGVVAAATRLQGGDLSGVILLRFVDGRQAVVKSGTAPRTEAAMLQALAAAGGAGASRAGGR